MMTTKHFLLLALLLLTNAFLFSQNTSNIQMPTSVNEDGAFPDSSAILDVQSTTKGMLIPRMTTSQRTTILFPATGLLVFDTDTGGFWFYNGAGWSDLSGGGGGGSPTSSIADTDMDTEVETENMADEDIIRFKVNGNEAMTIDSTGKVGIGVTDPSRKLTISGGGSVLGLDNGAVLTARNSSGTYNDFLWPNWYDNTTYLNYGKEGFHIRNNSSVKTLFMSDDNNVGIGVTNPTEDLHVVKRVRIGTTTSSLVFDGLKTPAVAVGGSTSAGVLTTAGNAGSAFHIGIEVPSNDDFDGFYIATDANHDGVADTLAMKVIADGRVGIGTTSPDQKLHVHKGSAGGIVANGNEVAVFENNTHAYLSILTPDADESGLLFGSPSKGKAAGGVVYNNVNTANGLQFRTNGNQTRMVVDGSGQVGIGTTAPANKLDVEGGLAIGAGYSGSSAAPTNGAIIQGNVGIGTTVPGFKLTIGGSNTVMGLDNGGVISAKNSSGNYESFIWPRTSINRTYLNYGSGGFQIRKNGSNTNAGTTMFMTDDNKVGIGTITPVNKLDVEGGMAIGAGYSGSTAAPANGAIIQGNVGIGTSTMATGYKLSVDGKIACEEVLVDLDGDWPDYVFKEDYNLKTLAEVKNHIDEKGHLPGVPSAQEVEEEGIVLGEMNKVLMEKIEELTLYILQQEERIKKQENRIKEVEQAMLTLKNK